MPSLIETEHLKVTPHGFGRLADMLIKEATRSLIINRSPYDITLEQVKDKSRMYAAGKIRGFIDGLDVIRHKPSSRSASSKALESQYAYLIRKLRLHLHEEMVDANRKIFFKARKRLINEAEHAVFCVRASSVQLHRLERTRQYGQPTFTPRYAN